MRMNIHASYFGKNAHPLMKMNLPSEDESVCMAIWGRNAHPLMKMNVPLSGWQEAIFRWEKVAWMAR